MPTVDEIAAARRQAFNDIIGKLVTPTTGRAPVNFAQSILHSLPTAVLNSASTEGGIKLKKSPAAKGASSAKKSSVVGKTILSLAAQKEASKTATDTLIKANVKDGVLEGTVNHPGWFERNISSHVPNPVKETLAKAVDYVSRPASAVNTAMLHSYESGEGGVPTKEQLAVLPDEIKQQYLQEAINKAGSSGVSLKTAEAAGSGALQGIRGKEHTGFGNVYEKMLQSTDESNPLRNKWVKRGVGFTGDVLSDPATYLSFGAKTALRGGEAATREIAQSGVKDLAQVAGKDAYQAAAEKAVARAVTDKGKAAAIKVIRDGNEISADDAIKAEVRKAIDKTVYDIHGGPQAGKVIGTSKQTASLVGNTAAEAHRGTQLEELSKFTTRFRKSLGRGEKSIPVKELNALKKSDPLIKAWHDSFIDSLKRAGDKDWDRAGLVADKTASRVLASETKDIATQVAEEMRRATLRIPTIKIMGQEIAQFPRVGKFAEALATSAGETRVGSALERARKALSYSGNFPGYTTLIGQKVRAEGLNEFNQFRSEVIQAAKDTTRADRKAIQHAIETDMIGGLPTDLQAKALEVKGLYDRIRNDEVAAGFAGPNAHNYTYSYLHGGDESKRAKFLAPRSDEAKTGQILTHTTAKAKELGLRPEEDAYKNLLYRKLKSNRGLTDHYFKTDLAAHYGFKSTMTPIEARARSLVQITGKDLPVDVAASLKTGEKLFIDKDIKDVYTKFTQLNKVGTEESKQFIRTIDYVTRKFKTLNTIYYPGFHVRNFISDMYMGALDGVKTKEYGGILSKMIHAAKDPNIDMDIGGRTVKWSKFREAYDRNAASGGFLEAELTNTALKGQAEGVKTLLHPGEYNAGIRRLSEHREDFGRLVHFYHAMSEELPAQLKKTGTPWFKEHFDTAWDNAVNAAVFRVNKYKFDYGALTRLEQGVIRRGIPFYTYARKAIPTLAESTLMSPRLLSYTDKWMQDLMPQGNKEGFEALDLPDYVKNTGFAQITGGAEPWGITGSALPQNVLQTTTDNPLAQLNPLIQAPFELQSHKDIFSGKKINGVGDLITSNIRAFQMYNKLSNKDINGKEKLASVFGIPVLQIDQAKKDGQMRRLEHEFSSRLGQWNEQAKKKGYTIYLSTRKDGVSLRVNKTPDPVTGKTSTSPKEFQSLDEALKFVGLK